MTDYVQTAEAALTDLCHDVLVGAHLAKSGRLTPELADDLASRVKAASSVMVEPGDRELLRYTAAQLGAVSTRIKAGAATRTRAKASNGSGSRSVRRAEPDYLALAHAADAEQMSFGGPFDRTEHEDVERRRAESANAALASKQRKLEADRRTQVSPEPETPWWR
jgi:hypothetical protein